MAVTSIRSFSATQDDFENLRNNTHHRRLPIGSVRTITLYATAPPKLDQGEWPTLGGKPTPSMKPTAGPKAISPTTSTLPVGAPAPRAQIGTAKGGLAMLLANSRPSSRAPSDAGDIAAEPGDDEELVAYEVAIDEDYISKDIESRNTSRTASPSRHRKKVTCDDFEPVKCLGKGAYGTVLLVRHKATGRLFAQKMLKKASIVVHKRAVEQTKTERAILESVRHPNVVKLFYAFQDQDMLYLILEYAEGGELFHHLANERMFAEDTVAYYIAQLVLALSHLHLNVGVVYRDLKPENCLLDGSGQLLLTDFGLSKVSSSESRCCSLLGTPGYMAPEILADNGNEYGAEVDWWGVGILTYELLTGNVPYDGSSPEKVKKKIQTGKLILPFYLSADAKDFINRLLKKEPNKRLGYNLAKDLPIIKAHRFFRKINWKKLEARELQAPIQPLVTDPLLAENFSSEFTDLPMRGSFLGAMGDKGMGAPAVGIPMKKKETEETENPFGGFSFVNSSLLEKSFLDDRGDW
ncbi:kinase-like domain-containing protein [Pyronema omphalodes]|nr:kinase-like domain-containing protein [Pyronema omphalodes]